MRQPRTIATTLEPTAQALAAIKAIEAAFKTLVAEADVSAIDKLLGELALALDVPTSILSPASERVRTTLLQQRGSLANDLREIAEARGCEVRCPLPYVSVGCVTLHERRPNEWSLSVLDDVPIQTIRTTNGRSLAAHALRVIDDIESFLEKWRSFTKDLRSARDALRRANDDTIPANALMLLCAHGSALHALLTSPRGAPADPGISRAQFGFLLRRLADEAGTASIGLTLAFSGATQHDTRHPEHYISIPDVPDPRRHCGHRRVASVTLSE